MGCDTSGYCHAAYAQSLAEFGECVLLPRSRGWILKRPIPGTPCFDGIGCYPLFSCQDWSAIRADLDDLRGAMVALSLIADPFGAPAETELRRGFDLVHAFKPHYVVNFRRPLSRIVSKHHQTRVRRALRTVSVEWCERPLDWLESWTDIYSSMMKRRGVGGIRAFSSRSFAGQFEVPGLAMFRARAGDETLGFHLWFQSNGVAYSHLTATTARGRRLGASYALYWRALEWLSSRVESADLGGAAGTIAVESNGLAWFKQGWSNQQRPTFLCGSVLNDEFYTELARARGPNSRYFPAYRSSADF